VRPALTHAAGCTETTEPATARRRKELNVPDEPLAKFWGTVTIDGSPPDIQSGHELLVFLYDPKTANDTGKAARSTICKPDGTFEFGTTIVPATYIVLFAELVRGRPGIFRGPDVLNNLYNDPDVNAKRDGCTIDLSPPGKTGAVFNLEVSGKDPVTTLGPHAVVKAGWSK
jgi:hypothetical protein